MSSTLKNPQISLRALLAGAPRCSREVLSEMAALGFSAKQVRSAREKLRLVTTRSGSGETMRTTWALLPGEAIRAHADRRPTPAPACERDTSEGQQKSTSAPPDSGPADLAACSEKLGSPQATVPTGPAVRSAAVRSQVGSGEGVTPALGTAGGEGTAPTAVDMAPAAAPSPAVATMPPQVVGTLAELPRGPGFGDSLQRGRRIDTMPEAELRAYARTIGISPRDCDGLTVERLRQNCTAHLYELIDAL